MPVVSKAQRRWAYAVKEGKVEGVKPSVGEEFLAAPAPAKLPEKVSKRKKKSLAGAK